MLDLTQPLELDDGRPLKILNIENGNGRVRLRAEEGYANRKNNDWQMSYGWWYKISDGTFDGPRDAAKTHYVARNADNAASFIPEDWS